MYVMQAVLLLWVTASDAVSIWVSGDACVCVSLCACLRVDVCVCLHMWHSVAAAGICSLAVILVMDRLCIA